MSVTTIPYVLRPGGVTGNAALAAGKQRQAMGAGQLLFYVLMD
ncbi:MAG: hypothetical protein P4N59_06550 [Negativicutes bacterium]|nr:hypothetical protein [Negativicutes bacterium]